MAAPLTIRPATPVMKDEIRAKLDKAAIDHAGAILSGYEVLQLLQDRGVLDMLRGALGASDTLIVKLATAANSKECIDATRNLVSLTRILASVDPELLHRLADELTAQSKPEAADKRPGLWSAIRTFASRDSRYALAGSAAFLQAFGKALYASKTKR